VILSAHAKFKRFTSTFLFLVAVFIFSLGATAQQVWNFYGEAEKGIVVTGLVKGEAGSGASGSVKIYRDGKFYQEVFPGPGGKYEVELPFDSDYELVYSIPGCVTKKIKVETNLPAEAHNQTVEPLAFNMSLPKATNGPLDEAYEVPVSRLFFDKSIDDFNRDMVTEETFRNTLKAKQAEHKRWLEEQKQKEELEKTEKQKIELEKKKTEDAVAKQKADEAAAASAKKKAEEDARRAAEVVAQKKAQEEIAKKAQEEALLKKQRDEELRKQEELRQKQVSDSLFKENERIKLEKLAAAKEVERLKKEAADKALQDKQNAQQLALLAQQRKKEIIDSTYQANEKIRLAQIAADMEAEKLRKMQEQDKLIQAQQNAQQQALAEQRRKAIADSLSNENEGIRIARKAEAVEAEKRRKEENERARQEKLDIDKAAAVWAVTRQKEIQDSILAEKERARLAQEESQKLPSQENAINTAAPLGGSGKSVFYQVDVADGDRQKDFSAIERTKNWERIRRERKEAYFAKIQRKKEEGERVKASDTKKQKNYLEQKRLSDERKAIIAERNRQKEAEAEAIRQARLKESLEKKVVILVAYSSASTQNPNAKFYGYVNFGDGKGPLELTESEYKSMASRFNGIYNKP
jgi:hypothetical protein